MPRTGFLDKTLFATASLAERFLASEAFARSAGLLQALDVRVKLLSFLFLLIVVSLLHTLPALWFLYGVSLLLAVLSGVPVGHFLARVWLFVPLFTAAVVLPALLNIITPGDPLWVVLRLERPYAWGPYVIPKDIAVTSQGLWGAVLFVSRVATSVSFAVLLTLTTRWNHIFTGLRGLFVPRVFVMTLSMTLRYLFVLLRTVQDLFRARKSRTIGPEPDAAGRSWAASRVGFLFVRSMEMNHEVHRAMISRGYHGEALSLERLRTSPRDYVWLVMIVLLGVLLLLGERTLPA